MKTVRIQRMEDGKGPYIWHHVVIFEGELCVGSIYHKIGDALTDEQVETIKERCEFANYNVEINECPS